MPLKDKAALKVYMQEYTEKHRERLRVMSKKRWAEKGSDILAARRKYKSETYWANNLKYHYGITKETYLQMLSDQGESCGICKVSIGMLNKRLSVDHCHKTGRVRGLLCQNCNAALGQLRESEEITISLLDYIRRACKV